MHAGNPNDQPLGIFDSGVGGLTVVRELLNCLSQEDILYLGDTARVPYGDKSPKTVIRFSLQNASFLAEKNIKLLVVACNTASAYAAEILREMLPFPVVDVIEPTVAAAVKATKNGKIAVMGTQGTIDSGIYVNNIKLRLPFSEVVSVPCPLLVPLVEEGFLTHRATKMILKEYMKPIKKSCPDTIILGCTHYPLLLPLIQQELGGRAVIINSAVECSKNIVEELNRMGLKKHGGQKGKRKYYASDLTEKFKRLGERFLGVSVASVEPYRMEEEGDVLSAKPELLAHQK